MKIFYNIFTVLLFITSAVAAQAQKNAPYATKFNKIDSLGIGYDDRAKVFINDYINNPKQTAEALGRYLHHKPFIDSVFKTNKIPTQVGLFILAASNADIFYEDENSNIGPWAMQYRLARMYGLKMNTYVDERRDFESTTKISAKYLKELFLIYNSWPMAFAAYSSSTLTVNKFIRKAGNNFNYWEMYDSMPQAAKDIVPAFVASAYIYYYHKDHNITPEPYITIQYDTVRFKDWMSFDVMAPALRTTVPVLQTLNPIFKKGVIPLSAKPYVVKLPVRSKPWFRDLDTLTFKPYNSNPYVEEVPELADKNLPKPKNGGQVFTGGDTVYHVVSRGEGLGIIAQRYGVKVDEIRAWNNIKGYMIHPKQKLMIIRRKGD